MNLVLRTLLVAALAFSISCSRGGADDAAPVNGGGNAKTDNSAFKNVAGSVLGQWSAGNGLLVFISDNRLKKVETQCENNQSVQAEVSITLTSSSLTILETKSVAKANCSIELKKGSVVKYSVNGDSLTLQMEGQEPMSLTRIQGDNEPAPNNGGDGGGNNAQIKLELYTGANCTGQKIMYTAGMNCTQLGGNVASLKQVGNPQCQNLNTTQDSRALCNEINQQLAGQ